MQGMAFENLARAPADGALQPAFATPEGPIQAALVEVGIRDEEAAVHFHLGGNRRRQKRRIEHLKGYARRSDGDSADIPHIAAGTIAGQNTERSAQVRFYDPKFHAWFSIADAAATRRISAQ